MTADLQRGLEGVAVAETRLSRVDGDAGELTIAGFPLDELAPNATFEETLFALYEDRLPDADELDAFQTELAEKRHASQEAIDTVVAAADRGLPPMDAVRMGTAAASLTRDGDEDPRTDAALAVAQLPTVAAAYERARDGDDPVEPREDLSHAANYLYMLDGEEPSAERVRGLETYLNSVVDHGLNASTFTARTVVSTESDVISGVTGAVGALKGPLHGGAPGPVLDMLEDAATADDPGDVVRETLDAGERVMGFGHRVYNVRDPRAAVLQDAAESFYEGRDETAFFDAAREFEDVAVDILAEHKPDLRLETNVEFYTAVLLNGVGVPRDMFTPTFAVARAGGWTAHCLEQLEDNRLIRPRASYVGAEDREWTPVDER
ncbi:citrate synthase [Halobacterium bonnevillei]|uniref:Citrate synthase n=1 Tax=Halobacterium bonnevillei TaxID=2692200 RepID=A0A6B0SHS7_9EURY|nr:citrate synthase [Halobacterium bonnevillei]MXR19431.1 citrate synthase [Halobacterium bonnevillei]